MLTFLKRLLSHNPTARPSPAIQEPRSPSPTAILVDGLEPFSFVAHIKTHHGFPIVDWEPVESWIADSVPESRRAAAWGDCERAWLSHFRDALGPGFRLDEGPTAMVLSSLEPHSSRSTLRFMERTLRKIGAVLDGITEIPAWGKDLLIIFEDDNQYYEYVSYYYPESGEFSFSSGMHITRGCSHFVTTRGGLQSLEPTIAHEMTHGCLAHLPIPLWLDEGIAVNTERRLTGVAPRLYTPEQMNMRHKRFWGKREIQEFWSGKSFRRTDDGNMLSYDLARILVEQFAKEWGPFKAFTLAADYTDSGSAAALEHLRISLGAAATAVLEQASSPDWEPNPDAWEAKAETAPSA